MKGKGLGEKKKKKKKKQLKFNVYVTRVCSSLQHLESCLEERDKALCCPPLWTCNGFSPLYDSSPLLFMYHKRVPVYTEAPLRTPLFCEKAATRPRLEFCSSAKVVLAQTALLSLLSCSCKKYLPYYHRGSAPRGANNDVKFHQASAIFPSRLQENSFSS